MHQMAPRYEFGMKSSLLASTCVKFRVLGDLTLDITGLHKLYNLELHKSSALLRYATLRYATLHYTYEVLAETNFP
jgi:hypothetical protein